MYLTKQQTEAFQQKILTWYAEHKRNLPWRTTRDPYCILISEVMSQQTQLNRVIPKYEMWVKTLPTVGDLARASIVDVLTLWSGLGYNRRALYLQKAAQKIVSDFNGQFPDDETLLQTLPGIGEYTAKAIVCFAFNKQVAVVDTNVRKVILTQILGESRIEKEPLHNSYVVIRDSIRRPEITEKDIKNIAESLLPHGKAYEWNQALMDYAGAVLKKEKIFIPKQSKFKDSDRYYRGQIIKLLLAKKQTTRDQLLGYFRAKNTPITNTRLTYILEGLCKDALIQKRNDAFSLP